VPYRKERHASCPAGKPIGVVKQTDGHLMGCHASEADADRQIAALYASEEMAANSGPETVDVAMIAVYPRAEEAERLAAADGLGAADLHCTLVFLGDAAELDRDAITAAVGNAVAGMSALEGAVGGVGHFASGEDGVPLVLLPDIQGLSHLRERVVSALEGRGIRSPSEHGFLPHMTLRYSDNGEVPDGSLIGEPLHFDAVSVVVADRRQDYALSNGGDEVGTEIAQGTVKVIADFSEFDAALDERLRRLGTVTITIGEDGAASPAEMDAGSRWEGILAFEGYPSDGDSGIKRFLMTPVGYRDLPLPVMAQFVNAEGHEEAQIAGRIDMIERIPASEFTRMEFELPENLPEDAVVIFGSGVFDTNEAGQEVARLVEEKILRGVSVDLAGTTWVPLDGETFQEISEDELGLERILGDNILAGAKDAKISGVTIVAHPSFGNARVSLVACAAFASSQIVLVSEEETLVACAAGPIDPPAEWFADPKFKRLTPLSVTPDGRVLGHVATWDCHAGYEGMCMMARPTRDGYARFHTGGLVTAEGETVRIGRITVKQHAPARMTPEQVMAHYSDAKKVAAFVRIYDDGLGIAAAGVTRSDANRELLRDFLANPPSGDWRRGELLGFSCVPLPGLPIAAPEAYFVASADGTQEIVPEMLLLPPIAVAEDPSEADILLAAAAVAGADALDEIILEPWPYLDEMRTFTEEQRREYARKGIAMPDGSFPIPDCAAASDAIRSQGRGQSPASQRRVVRHIKKRVRSLGCSGAIFDDYK